MDQAVSEQITILKDLILEALLFMADENLTLESYATGRLSFAEMDLSSAEFLSLSEYAAVG